MNHNNWGWFKYYRSSTENEFYFSEPFDKWHAWIDLLTLAEFAPRTVFIRGIEFNLQPGDLIQSQKKLAKRWKWSNKTVIRFLNLLSSRGQISIKVHHKISVISIVNWAFYQFSNEEREPQTTPQNTPQTTPPIRNNKNNKNNSRGDICFVTEDKMLGSVVNRFKKKEFGNVCLKNGGLGKSGQPGTKSLPEMKKGTPQWIDG